MVVILIDRSPCNMALELVPNAYAWRAEREVSIIAFGPGTARATYDIQLPLPVAPSTFNHHVTRRPHSTHPSPDECDRPGSQRTGLLVHLLAPSPPLECVQRLLLEEGSSVLASRGASREGR